MAKEFKDFDKVYSKFKGTALKTLEANGTFVLRSEIEKIKSWADLKTGLVFTEAYSIQTIREAVYECSTAEAWQKFRVSLKGLTTQEKLFALSRYYIDYIFSAGYSDLGADRVDLRINNYLGALKRGGQLNSLLEVVK